MLPTLAARADNAANLARANQKNVDSRRPCRSRSIDALCALDWTDVDQAPEAAAWCDRCPQAEACLAAALRADVAYRRGESDHPPYGVRGGVWFELDHAPARIPHWPVAL